MENAKTRKDALRIESALLNKIAAKGVSTIANAIGVNASQITRWKESLIPRMSMILAVLEYGIEDEEMAELTKRLASYLTKEKTSKNCEFLEA
ncbi:bacteriophage CII protein [Yokenella regensburgei]|uniref:Bacteriophage CII protein n=1 Tax=Yokenella regensburgei TaxID=158877 RepID=A0ABX9RU52_9ENTR|nr:CII family transcriptional regulator [Yokenella regensburgei]RKR53194.1 bacteriophage CII protein [Yokenella regensburgei]VFS16103.1 Bacteriophage CII protein [Yokenella regensburgei]